MPYMKLKAFGRLYSKGVIVYSLHCEFMVMQYFFLMPFYNITSSLLSGVMNLFLYLFMFFHCVAPGMHCHRC